MTGEQNPMVTADTFKTEALAKAIEDFTQHSTEPKLSPKLPTPLPPQSRSKASSTLRARQKMRKFHGTGTPNPTLGIELDEFTSSAQHLRSSMRILALIGAGLSWLQGFPPSAGMTGDGEVSSPRICQISKRLRKTQ
jgi:hypothetical protein